MFPFLPALLLLLIQSHSAMDRSMAPGLPAITWQIVAQQLAREGNDQPTLEGVCELIHLLRAPKAQVSAPDFARVAPAFKLAELRHVMPQGFTQGRRSRDGPSFTA